MSDQNVKAAQKYLNAMFGGHKDWVKLDEDGKTGTAVMQGIIRAFQIQNGISTITGTVGPLTINTMKKLAIITKMDPNDTPQVNVCLIQCALFCKGYAAGGITGIYYTSGVNAVKKMQENAGLEVTGKIDWKVWSGLLSLNWFTKVSGGDSNIVLIQHSPYPRRMSRYDAAPCSPTQSEARNHIMRFPRMTPPPSAPDVAVKPTTIRFSSSMILSIVRWIRCSPTHDWSMSIVRPSPSGLIASSYSSSASALALPAAYSCNSCNPIRVSRYGRLWPRNWRIATRK